MHLVYISRCVVHTFAFIIAYSCMYSTLHHSMHGLLKCQSCMLHHFVSLNTASLMWTCLIHSTSEDSP